MLKKAIFIGHADNHRTSHFETSGVTVRKIGPAPPPQSPSLHETISKPIRSSHAVERHRRCPQPCCHPRHPRLPNLKALTSIRFFAALHVALYHFVNPHTQWGILTPVINVGYIGVSFFFVLSGFILTYSHAREYEAGRGNALKFYVARLARIYPVYLVSLALSAYVFRSEFHPAYHILAFGSDLLMLQSWSLRMVNYFNVPAWSLSVEAFFYLVFPFIFMRLRPSSRTRSLLTMFAFWLVALAGPIICLKLYPIPSWSETLHPNRGAEQVFRLRRLPLLALPEFLAGVSLGWFYLRFGITRRLSSLLAAIGIFTLASALFLSNHIPFVLLHNGVMIPIFGVLILGLCEPNWLSRPLSRPTLILLGEASFALYLIHYILNTWTYDSFGAPETIPTALWKLAIVIPASVALHLYVERPGRRLILAWWHRRHPAQLNITPA